MKRRLALGGIAVLLLIAGCSTVPDEGDGNEFIGMINSGEWEVLSDKSGSPFLLDREMIMREADMREFWKILAEGGFALGETDAIVLDAEASAERYGTGLEIEQFFAKYVPQGAVTFVLESRAGRFYMTLGKEKDRVGRIYAFAGPVEKEVAQ